MMETFVLIKFFSMNLNKSFKIFIAIWYALWTIYKYSSIEQFINTAVWPEYLPLTKMPVALTPKIDKNQHILVDCQHLHQLNKHIVSIVSI